MRLPTEQEIADFIRDGIASGRIRVLTPAEVWAMQHPPHEPEPNPVAE